MRIIPGKIVESDQLDEGETIHVLVDDDERITLTPEEEAELATRMAAMDRGEFVEYESAETLIRVLRARRGGGRR